MNRLTLILPVILLTLYSCEQTTNKGQIPVEWVKFAPGDFSFKNNWSYPEGVYRNNFGQLSCDGFCPDGIDLMQDKDGRILPDSLPAFYKLIDTTHQLHSIQCDAWCYEWAGTDFITVEQPNKDTVFCATQTNAATHCSLILKITNEHCFPQIELNSISLSGQKSYHCTGGFIKISKELWSQGIMKAAFSFTFDHTENPGKPMFWKGNIYAKR